jgi:hypothetical protein
MRPNDYHDIDQLRVAHARAEELRAAWHTANYGTPAPRPPSGAVTPAVGRVARNARAAAGRALIGIGRRVLPAETGPCA